MLRKIGSHCSSMFAPHLDCVRMHKVRQFDMDVHGKILPRKSRANIVCKARYCPCLSQSSPVFVCEALWIVDGTHSHARLLSLPNQLHSDFAFAIGLVCTARLILSLGSVEKAGPGEICLVSRMFRRLEGYTIIDRRFLQLRRHCSSRCTA